MPRICLYPKDVATLTGRSYDSAKRLVRRARQAAGKPAGALVTVQDFCRLTGLDAAEVSAALNACLVRPELYTKLPVNDP